MTDDTHGLDRDRWTGRKAVDLARRDEVGDAGDGEPAWLTLRALLRTSGAWYGPTGEDRVRLVEGTALMELAAAEELPMPLVCHGGVPNSAVLELCRQLVDAGWRLAISADMEPTPLSAVAGLLGRFSGLAEPWRLTAKDLDGAQRSGTPFVPERVPDTPWDPHLAARLRADPRRSTEEDRLEVLRADLRTAASNSPTSRRSRAKPLTPADSGIVSI